MVPQLINEKQPITLRLLEETTLVGSDTPVEAQLMSSNAMLTADNVVVFAGSRRTQGEEWQMNEIGSPWCRKRRRFYDTHGTYSCKAGTMIE